VDDLREAVECPDVPLCDAGQYHSPWSLRRQQFSPAASRLTVPRLAALPGVAAPWHAGDRRAGPVLPV